MDIPQLPEQTHARSVVVAYGLVFALLGSGLIVFAYLAEIPATLSALVYGYAVPVVIFALLLILSTPATGSIDRKLRIYRLQLAVVTVVPLAATVRVLATPHRDTAIIGLLPLGVLYLALQIDWADARRHLERMRAADDPNAVQWIPPEALTLTRHVMYGVVSVEVGYLIFMVSSLPLLAEVLVVAAFIVGGLAVFGATPHRGSVERTAFALKTLVFGPGVCLLLAGPALVAGGGSIVAAIVLSGVGAVPLYYGLVRADWELTGPIIREMRTADEVTWDLAEAAKETVLSRRDDADVSGPSR